MVSLLVLVAAAKRVPLERLDLGERPARAQDGLAERLKAKIGVERTGGRFLGRGIIAAARLRILKPAELVEDIEQIPRRGIGFDHDLERLAHAELRRQRIGEPGLAASR